MIVLLALLGSMTFTTVVAATGCPEHCTCAGDAPFSAVNCTFNTTADETNGERNVTDEREKGNLPDAEPILPVMKTTNTYMDLISSHWNFVTSEKDEKLNEDIKIAINVTKATALTISIEWVALNKNDHNIIAMKNIKAFELSYHIAGSENVKWTSILPKPVEDTRTGEESPGVFEQKVQTYTIEMLHPRSKFYVCLTAMLENGGYSKQYCRVTYTGRGDIETISDGEIDLKIQIGVALGCIFGVFVLSCVSMCVWISKQRCNSDTLPPNVQFARSPVHQV